MKLIITAVGTRLPAWVDAACTDYLKRMPRELPMTLIEIKSEPRVKPVAALLASEARRIEAALPARCRRIVLDERGADISTRQLAQKLADWAQEGEDTAFIIGGPDGLDASLKKTATETWRLSSLTLPHALARVLLIETLYRAASVNANHPYHRE